MSRVGAGAEIGSGRVVVMRGWGWVLGFAWVWVGVGVRVLE